jgi:hypothetical protein
VAAKGYCLADFLALAVGQTFGDCSSPPNFEPIARARCALAEHYSKTDANVPLFPEYTAAVVFQPEPDDAVTFTPATADRLNPGVQDANGDRLPTAYNMHVDDSLYAEVGRQRLLKAMRHSIHALHEVLGGDDPTLRPRLVDQEKFHREPIGHRRTQLGVVIDTRRLTVEMTDAKHQDLWTELTSRWGTHRRSFTVLEAAELLGKLIDAANTCTWGIFLFISLQQTMHRLLARNHNRLMQTREFQDLVSSQRDSATQSAPSRLRWFNKKIGKALWASKAKTFIDAELRNELDFLTLVFSDRAKYRWEAPIALLIPRDPSYETLGDACLTGAGGFSLSLHFWWALEWPDYIECRTLRHLGKRSSHLISINLLEYATIVLGLAASILAWEQLPEPKPFHPLLLMLTDNTTAESWTKRIAGLKSPQARCLARLFCHLLMFSPEFGIKTEHIEGEKNKLADFLSRLRRTLGDNSPLNFSDLAQTYPALHNCRRFHPSPELLSLLFSSLSSGSASIPTTRVPLGHLSDERIIISSSATRTEFGTHIFET